jgi:glycosyltransferase involved in cell wall biosynthesis
MAPFSGGEIGATMNIAMLLETLSLSNGVSRIALSLSEKFVERGHEVHIYASRNRLQEGGRKRFPDPKIQFHWLPSLRGSWRAWSLPLGALLPVLGLPMINRLPPRMSSFSRRHDVVISHALTLKQDVIQMHNDPQPVEESKLTGVPFSVDPPRLKTARRTLRTAIERLRFTPDNYRSVIAHSARSARETSETFGIPTERIDVIPHGVDSAYFCPSLMAGRRIGLRRHMGLTLSDVVFLYIGDSWKGLEFAIRGLAKMPPSAKAVLLAAGPFSKPIFTQFAREQGVRLLCGDLHDDVRLLYCAADVLLNPTPLDTFSLVGLEAMAMRLPIITTRYAGMSELLSHGKNAIILDSAYDEAPIAEACLKLLDVGVRLNMAERARQFAVSRTWEQVAGSHLRHYTALRGEGVALASRSAV